VTILAYETERQREGKRSRDRERQREEINLHPEEEGKHYRNNSPSNRGQS
jgi:hypothetical protein